MAKLLYQGHASMRFQSKEGKVLYLDPYAGDGYQLPADLVLITHEHYDHNQISLVPMTPRTIIIRAKDALANNVYNHFDYCGFHIQAVPAYNQNHARNECVGYLIEVDGVKLYCAGDTSTTDYMETLGKMNIDYAFLPIDGVYNMGPKEASDCARVIKPKHLIPIHSKPGMLFDMKQTMQVDYENAMLVRPGDIVEL